MSMLSLFSALEIVVDIQRPYCFILKQPVHTVINMPVMNAVIKTSEWEKTADCSRFSDVMILDS